MMVERISVLMCVYNTQEDYLREAINSILNQTYKNIEFVIVDDGSTIEIKNILSEYEIADSRVKIITNSNNIGLTKSLNIGLNYCNGKYIARMDSDDISLPTRLEEQKKYLDNNEDVVLVGSDIICFGNNIEDFDTSKLDDRYVKYEIYKIHSLFHHSGPPHPTFMFRTEFLRTQNIRYREEITRAQDYGIMADILKAGGVIKKIRQPLLKYRNHENQITSKALNEQRVFQLKISYDYIKYLFNEMTKRECLAVAMLGCEMKIDEVRQLITENGKINSIFDNNDIRNLELLYRAKEYIQAQKKMLSINSAKNIFDNNMLKKELYAMWLDKIVYIMKKKRKMWGVSFYSFNCLLWLCWNKKYK